MATTLIDPLVHDGPAMRGAGADRLSLALMDARSRTLAWLTAFEDLALEPPADELEPPLWLIGHAAWYQEYWIARHLQRSRGPAADAAAVRLPSVLAQADALFDPQVGGRRGRWRRELPSADELRDYLAATLEATLELLDKAPADDAGLHVFRQALHHEDRIAETLAELAQALDLPEQRLQPLEQGGWLPPLPSRMRREPLAWPGQLVELGTPAGGWVPESERERSQQRLADFEIDAQPVTWADYAEFIDDGGYDRRECWGSEGWDWLEASTRRAPRYVEQVTGGVLARRLGRMQRVPAAQPVLHVSAHEAQAWCRWAGRRLPTEAEWQLAVQQGARRGLVWGEVLEWVAGRDPRDAGLHHVRGATLMASPRLRHVLARRSLAPAADAAFIGFRSCAL